MRLSQIAEVKAGNVAPKANDFTQDGLPFVRAGSLAGLLRGDSLDCLEKLDGKTAARLKMKLFPAGTVVFAKSGMSCLKGYVYTLPEPCYIVSHLACVTPKGNYSSYLRHYFRANKPNRLIENPSFPSIKLGKISAIEINLPKEDRINEIVSSLEMVEAQIELLKKENKLLDDLVKSRFVEMFGDPVANLKGWETSSLTSLGSCKNGMNFKSKKSGIELPCLGVGDFKDRSVIRDVSEMGRVNLGSEPDDGYFLKDGDIVFVRSNGNKKLVGRCLAVYPHGKKAVYSGFCIRLRVESEKVRIPYLIWTLKQPSMRRQMFGRGANVQNLNQKLLAKVEVPLPPLVEQDRFLDFVAQVDKSGFVALRA